MSSVSKGGQWQNEFRRILQHRGYSCITAKRIMWQSQDYWGCWDLMGVKDGERTVMVQVSSWKCKASKVKQVSVFSKDYLHRNCIIALRMRNNEDKRHPKPHFRLLEGSENFEWKGCTIDVEE